MIKRKTKLDIKSSYTTSIKLLTTIFLFFAVFNLNLNAQSSEVTSLINAGKYEEAISQLKKQLKQSEDVEQLSLIYNQIGEIQYEHLHDYTSALKTYQSIVELSPKGVSKYEIILSLMKIGDTYCRLGEYDKAIQTYQRLMKDYPETTLSSNLVQRKVQRIKTALNRLEEQKKILQNNLQNQSKDTDIATVQAHFQIAEILRTSLNNPEAAIARYEKLLKDYPYSSVAPEAGWRIGYVYDKVLNLRDKAIDEYKKVVEKYPTSSFAAESLFRIGRIYEEEDNCNKALDSFNSLIQECPDFWKLPAVFYWKGICLEKMESYAKAIDAYKIFLIVYLPQTEQARLGDIGKYKQNKLKIEMEIESKISSLQAKLPEEKQPNTRNLNPQVEWNKAQDLIEKGNYLEALPIYRKLAIIAPNSEWIHKTKKQIRTIEYKAGIQNLRKKINSLLPKDYNAMVAQERIGEIYERGLKEYNKAIEEYNKLLLNYPKNSLSAKALYRIGDIYANTGKPAKAIEVYNKLIKEFPNSFESTMANYQLAEIYSSQGKYREAISAYKDVLKCPSKTHYIGNGYVDSFADIAQFRIGVVFYKDLRELSLAKNSFSKFTQKRTDSPRLAAAYVFLGLINEEQKEYIKAVEHLQNAIELISNNGSIQAEMIVNEIQIVKFPDKEPMTVMKYLEDKVSSLKGKKHG